MVKNLSYFFLPFNRMQNDVAQVEDVVGTYDRKGSNEWGKVHLRYTYAIPLNILEIFGGYHLLSRHSL